MGERGSKSESGTEAARNFIDSKFLPHADQSLVTHRVEKRLNFNENITPSFVRSLYEFYMKQSLDSFQDAGKTLQRDATNLAILKEADARLPEGQRAISVSDELTLFRNSLIAEVSSKIHNIKANIAAYGSFDNLEFVRELCSEELQDLASLNFLSTDISSGA